VSYFNEVDGRQTPLAVVAGGLLIAGAIVVALWPGASEALTGFRETPVLASPDELPALSSADAMPFLESRDQVEIRVTEATTLRRFLDRNRLNKPYHRKQIEAQLGRSEPETPIAAGTRFKLRLTPMAEDVPGTTLAPKAKTLPATQRSPTQTP
jgi:hypothetical protein